MKLKRLSAFVITTLAVAVIGCGTASAASQEAPGAPGKVSVTSVTTKNDAVYVKWDKVAGVSGYQVTYSTEKDFSSNKHNSYPTRPDDICLANIPKAGETWYIKVRAYTDTSGRVYGDYSTTFKIKVKGNVKTVSIPYSSYTYKGSAITPAVTVKDTLKNKLVENRDYTVAYKNNVNAGTAVITVTGKGNYQGTVQKNFTVKRNDLADNKVTIPSVNYIWLGDDIRPEPTVWLSGKKLVKNSDYTVSYQNNSNPGTGKVTVTGKGNYTGSRTRTFNIEKVTSGSRKYQNKTYTFDSSGYPMYYESGGVRVYCEVYLNKTISSRLSSSGLAAGK